MNILKTMRSHPIISGVAAVVVAVASVAGAAMAWGPTRETFTMQSPATYPVFNSITNNPTYGDERNFVTIKDVTANSQYKSSVDLVEGHEYRVQIYIHNDASETLNANGSGIAKDTTVTAFAPSVVDGQADVSATVAASNTKPAKVWDNAVIKSNGKVELQYISGSALLSRNTGDGKDKQTKLSDSLLTSGVKVGSYDLDGKWYACHGYAGAVFFNFKVKETPKADFTMDKQVRKHTDGTGGWVESYKAQPGEVVDFIIRYKNTGNVTQENVVVKDALPKGLEYVAGSTVLANANNPSGKKINDDVTTKGVNIGSYTAGSNAWVRFSAKVVALDKIECGTSTMKNVASVTTGAGTKTDDATVTVEKECQEEVKPVYKCDLLTIDKISTNEYKFSVKYTASNGATYKGTTYKVYDASGKEVYNSAEGKFSGFAAGTYIVKAFVTISVNGKDETVTSEACAQKVTIPEQPTPTPEKEKVCELETKKIITINKDEFDSSKHSRELDDCKETPAEKTIEVCNLETKTFITIKESEFDKTKHSNNPDDCKPAPTTPDNDITVCKREDKTIVTIKKSAFDTEKYTETLSECEETPETPAPTTTVTELPATGIGGAILSLSGVGSLGYAIYAYIASRRIQ